jgi:hypothetical protein
MNKITEEIKNIEFSKFINSIYNKEISNLSTWEYREALSLFSFNNSNVDSNISQEQVKKICHAVIKNQKFSWADLNINLYSEAEIQRHLRENGYELRCFNLDNFPTDSETLHKLLTKIKTSERIKTLKFKIFSWREHYITPALLISLMFVDLNIFQVFLSIFVSIPLLHAILHWHTLHNINLSYRNGLMRFFGYLIVYCYTFKIDPASKALHLHHHKLWKNENDPIADETKNNNIVMYLLGYSKPGGISKLVADNVKYDHAEFIFPKFMLDYRSIILLILFSIWVILFGFTSLVTFYLIPVWYSVIVVNRLNNLVMHGPHTHQKGKKARDYPWMMPIWGSSAFHITHHKYPNDLYFGPGLIRYLNLEYWFVLLFFNTKQANIKF